jgi:predicted transposase/invertase (TIGR01784 family)
LEYERYEMKRDEIMTSLSDAKEEGKAEGLAEGLAEGEAKKARETALVMLNKGLSLEMVSACTGLSKDEIKALAQ